MDAVDVIAAARLLVFLACIIAVGAVLNGCAPNRYGVVCFESQAELATDPFSCQ